MMFCRAGATLVKNIDLRHTFHMTDFTTSGERNFFHRLHGVSDVAVAMLTRIQSVIGCAQLQRTHKS